MNEDIHTTTGSGIKDAPSEEISENETQDMPEANARNSGIPTVPQLSVALGILLLLFGFPHIQDFLRIDTSSETTEKQRPAENTANIPQPQVTAQAAFVWDVAKQRALYSKNASSQLPLASLTKLMTALVAYETLGPNDTVAITLDAVRTSGDSGFVDGENFSASALIGYTLVTSSNDGAYAIAEAAGAVLAGEKEPNKTFLDALNIRAEELGLTQTYFTNPTGLDSSNKYRGSYGSARDIAFLMEYIIQKYPDLLADTSKSETRAESAGGTIHEGKNTNEVAGQIRGLIASKTGYTDLAGGNLVIAFDAGLNRPIIVSVLGSTAEGRFRDVQGLAQYATEIIMSGEES